jgi:chromosome segregation ATPase
VKFFEHSRDQWKVKCHEAKKTVKRLKNRMRWVEHSRARWKNRVKELEHENARLTAQNQRLTAALQAAKKTSLPQP